MKFHHLRAFVWYNCAFVVLHTERFSVPTAANNSWESSTLKSFLSEMIVATQQTQKSSSGQCEIICFINQTFWEKIYRKHEPPNNMEEICWSIRRERRLRLSAQTAIFFGIQRDWQTPNISIFPIRIKDDGNNPSWITSRRTVQHHD